LTMYKQVSVALTPSTCDRLSAHPVLTQDMKDESTHQRSCPRRDSNPLPKILGPCFVWTLNPDHIHWRLDLSGCFCCDGDECTGHVAAGSDNSRCDVATNWRPNAVTRFPAYFQTDLSINCNVWDHNNYV
jgi:hypothetical protein